MQAICARHPWNIPMDTVGRGVSRGVGRGLSRGEPWRAQCRRRRLACADRRQREARCDRARRKNYFSSAKNKKVTIAKMRNTRREALADHRGSKDSIAPPKSFNRRSVNTLCSRITRNHWLRIPSLCDTSSSNEEIDSYGYDHRTISPPTAINLELRRNQ